MKENACEREGEGRFGDEEKHTKEKIKQNLIICYFYINLHDY